MHMLQHVAQVRGVQQSQAASGGDAEKQSLPALAAAAAPVAYLTIGTDNIKQDLYLRGPVLATMQVTQHFCDYWSTLVRKGFGGIGYSSTKDKTHHATTTVVVVLVGWTKDGEWIVGLPWGALTDAVQDYGRNGCCLVKMGVMGLGDVCVGMLQVQPPVDDASVKMQVYKCVSPFVLHAKKKLNVRVKAKVILAHGDKKGQHPKSMMQKVSAGDIASITFMALTIAIVAIFLCFSLTRRSKKQIRK